MELSLLDYEQIFKALPQPIMIMRADLTIVAASDVYLKTTLTKREEIVGRKVFDVFPDDPDDVDAKGHQALKNSLERVLREKVQDVMATIKYDIKNTCDSNAEFEERHWQPVNTPVFDEHHEVRFIINQVKDVTDIIREHATAERLRQKGKQMEAQIILRTQDVKIREERLNVVLDASNMGVWEFDLVNQTAWRSLRYDQIFGYQSLQTDWGLEIFIDHVVPEDKEMVREKLSNSAVDSFLVECRIIRVDDQSIRWISSQGSTHRNEAGTIVRLMGTINDVTERKASESQREMLISQLQDALAHVKKLSGLLPICASCKMVRDDGGYWNQIEVYIGSHSEAEFSHSLCPGCAEKLYPGIVKIAK
ncbi:MAG: PAS domain S-box protein [Myxococcota bacterium]